VLKKIISIRNVGKFRRCCAAGDVQFGRATLIYAPNSRGKTTFCDICRSLKTGNADAVIGRATLGEGSPPTVDLLLQSGVVRFKDGAWSETVPELEVYDSRFIYENVYAGECVEHEQRRNLYDVIIGEQGVTLRRKVDELDDAFRRAGQVVNEKENAVQALIPGGVPFDKFVALEEDPEVDTKITEAAKKVAALERVGELIAKSLLSKVTLTTLPTGLDILLGRTLEEVSVKAEEAVRKHMSQHMQQSDEPWLVHGLELMRGDTCPFCARALSGSELLAAYKMHFSGKYRELKEEIERLTRDVRSFADDRTVLTLQRTIDENARLLAEWKGYISVSLEPTLDVAKIHAAQRALREAGLAVLGQKARSPLESVPVGPGFEAARGVVETMTQLVEAYNSTVELVNGVLGAKKEDAKSGDLGRAKRELVELQAVKIRHQDDAKEACREFHTARVRRKELDLEKQKARGKLEDYSRDVFQRYQSRINRLLENFGATFHIEKAGERYMGGKPSSTYCLVIQGEEVDLGDAKTPLSSPSFKNTLSAGDKSALALAFFLAKLDQCSDLARKIVVLDDPFTSQDASRQTCTHQEIRRLAKEAAQVIVLSHDRRFLKRVWDGLEGGVAKTLQFSEFGDTTVTAWDIESVQDEYVKTYTTLWLYCNRNEGDPQLVVRTIRPLLEDYLRMKLPREFEESKWLGDYVAQIRDADANAAVGQAKSILSELEELNDYSKRHHHPAGAEASDEPVDAQEVLAFGKRALKLVQAF
jgi:wobble nucleotide-excising tRNase